MTNVRGVCAVLNRPVAVFDHPMAGKPVMLGDPRAALFADSVLLHRDGKAVGIAEGFAVDGDLVRWSGRIDPPPVPALRLSREAAEDAWAVPFPEPTTRDLIAMGRLVAVVDAVRGSMSTYDGATRLSGWSIAGLSLIERRPWPELALEIY